MMRMMWRIHHTGLSIDMERPQLRKAAVKKKKKLMEMMRNKRKMRKGKKISPIPLYRGLPNLAPESVLIIMERE